MTVTTIGSSSHTIDVDGITTQYHKAGPGDPVLLLHGPWTWGSAWANWQHTILPLAANHHVLAPDVVGSAARS